MSVNEALCFRRPVDTHQLTNLGHLPFQLERIMHRKEVSGQLCESMLHSSTIVNYGPDYIMFNCHYTVFRVRVMKVEF